VSDEFKSMQIAPIRLSDGRLRLPGSMRLDQAAPLVGNAWRGRSDETVAGHLLTSLGVLPEPGQEFVIDGTPVEVEAVEAGAIASVIVGRRSGSDERGAR